MDCVPERNRTAQSEMESTADFGDLEATPQSQHQPCSGAKESPGVSPEAFKERL